VTGLVFLAVGMVALWVINRGDEAPPLLSRDALSRAFRAVATRRDTSRHVAERGALGSREVAPGVYVEEPERLRRYAVDAPVHTPVNDLDRWVRARLKAGYDRTSTAKKASTRYGVSLRSAQRACTRALGGDA
jgi:hypothetical protein